MAENNKKIYATPKLLSDSPLRDTDIARFHFDEFAITLARLIADPETRTPLTIGVSGKWGSGKTTLLQRVKKLLDEKGKPSFANENEKAGNFCKCKTVWFDAWKYNDEDELLVALVRSILYEMQNGDLKDKFKAFLGKDDIEPTYDFISMFINAFQFKFGGLGAEMQVKFDPEKHMEESPFKTHTAFFDYFDKAFENLMALWVHGKGNPEIIDEKKGALVVFIDDLDRCLPEKAVQVLEAVKLFLDKDGCVFVLGADTRIVQDAVVKHYREAGIRDENVGDYIEKLIQLRFDLPPVPEEEMNSYVDEHVEDEALVEHWRIITAGAEANPRKVKTFLNDLRLRWAMWQNTGQAGGVDFDDFVRWEVLMRAAPKFRTRVYGIPDSQLRHGLVENAFKMAGGDEDAAASFKDDVNQQMREILKNVLEHKDRFTLDVVNRLMYVVAPPALEPPVEAKEEVKVREEATLEVESAFSETKAEPVKLAREKAMRGEGVTSRAGTQVWADISFVHVPAGKFLMGSRKDNKLADNDEKEQHTVEIGQEYWIGRYPVTNEQYAKFVEETNQKHEWVKDWKKKLDHPVVNVSWHDAQAFCEWLNQIKDINMPDGYIFRLPTEAEWEKAARGEYGNEWPWGNEFDPKKCNSTEGGRGGTTPVGAYSPAGDSPYGAGDMAGNVWEWTQSLLKDYPYQAGDGREDLKGSGSRVFRGGSFYDTSRYVRCALRDSYNPSSGSTTSVFV
ncbi:MAG TPA: SUMF1/EgtB/PvdO family nonheme iron enzyme [Anaerolineales bacterium]